MLLEISTDNQVVIARAVHARLTTCISEVEDLVLSQEDNQACVKENGEHFEHRLTDCDFCIKYLLSNFRVMIR